MWQTIIDFWYLELAPKQWFENNLQINQLIAQRFGKLHKQAAAGELYIWRQKPLGRLAEIIVLDQFSRNLHRDSALAFANDAMALALAQEAISQSADQGLTKVQKQFLYMPFMHSESLFIHQQAEILFNGLGEPYGSKHEALHKAIIERFGRYPHRNSILGRESTAEELRFLQQPDSSF
ncbi:MAG: DUF924 family protein [Gammaproteobacteria bacterium]|jgi:uncharacterized protein (DUF924 family)|nr:DUF924 family protein [Gammaproteobacteria bacterium]